MKEEDKKPFAEKHPRGAKANPKIADAIRQKASKGKLACAVAFKISGDLSVTPAEIGYTLDILDIHINKCQLGLFGYLPEKRIVKPDESPSDELEGAIRESLVDGRLPCKASWDLADKFKLGKMKISAVCEGLGIKISSCQLGAF